MILREKFAKEYSLNLIPIDIGIDELNVELINSTTYFSDDLIADGSQIPSFLIAWEASKRTKVLLSGMGADELFLVMQVINLLYWQVILIICPNFKIVE
ncbi:MAG: hypothetical protein IPJ23_05850 [Ignavibacteriales bacterium]|nr:hypothetical protein [Ignavibacteriales bacterium]